MRLINSEVLETALSSEDDLSGEIDVSVITLFTSTLHVSTNLMMMNGLEVDSWKPIEQPAAASALTINNSSLSGPENIPCWNLVGL